MKYSIERRYTQIIEAPDADTAFRIAKGLAESASGSHVEGNFVYLASRSAALTVHEVTE